MRSDRYPAIPLIMLTAAGLAAVVFQSHFFKKKEEVALLKKPLISHTLYEEALKQKESEASLYPLAIKALRQKLTEEHQMDTLDTPLSTITFNAKTLPIKHLLTELENSRFAASDALNPKEVLSQLNQIFA